jgi:hypothetical protein
VQITVKQRLNLGSIAPSLLDAYRKDENVLHLGCSNCHRSAFGAYTEISARSHLQCGSPRRETDAGVRPKASMAPVSIFPRSISSNARSIILACIVFAMANGHHILLRFAC